MSRKVILSKQAVKDSEKLKSAGLKPQAEKLLLLLSENLFHTPPDYEKLVGNLNGLYSRRINIKHRLIYDADKKDRAVHVLRMWTHYK